MLKPTKHSHPDRTVIYVSLRLLSRLKEFRIEKYDDLRQHLKEITTGCGVLYLPALNFLYLLGLIEYHPNTDSVEYIGPNETI